MFLLRILFFVTTFKSFSLPFLAQKKIPEARHSTATYCAEIFFPFGESNFKGQRSRVTRWNLRKCNAAMGRGTIDVITGRRNNAFCGRPARCVHFINEKYRWRMGLDGRFGYAAIQIPHRLPLIMKLTSLFFDGELFVK